MNVLRAAVLATAVVLQACATPTPSAVPSPTPTASPMATPFDVAGAFVRIVTEPDFSATIEMSASVEIGVTGTMTGTFSGGPDATQARLVIEVAGNRTETEAISTGGKSYARTAPGPWLEVPAPAAAETSLTTWLGTLTSLADEGLVTKGGRSLHHLVPPGGDEIPADLFGLDPAVISDPKIRLDFYAEADGTPAVWSVDIDYTQKVGAIEMAGHLIADLTFTRVNEPVEIRPPTDVWVAYVGDGYSMAHPGGWTVDPLEGSDGFYDGDELWFEVAPYTDAKGLSASGFRDALIELWRGDVGDPRSAPVAFTLGGEPGWWIEWQWEQEGSTYVSLDAVAMHGDVGWDVTLYTLPELESHDTSIFRTALATFAFTKQERRARGSAVPAGARRLLLSQLIAI